MIVFVPKEKKQGEERVGATPEHAYEYVEAGAKVYVEASAGTAAGFLDRTYRQAGAAVVDPIRFTDAISFYHTLPVEKFIVLKVKEVLKEESDRLLSPRTPVVGFGHLASNEWLTKRTIERQATYLSLEDVVEQDGTRPVLRGMSVVAGEEAIRLAMRHKLSGEKPEVVIVGYGNVGKAAHRVARDEFCLPVTAIDSLTKLILMPNTPTEFRFVHSDGNPKGMLSGVISKMYLKHYPLQHSKPHPILLVLAPYSPENRAPVVVTTEMLKYFPKDSSIVDVSIDQGGACEFSRATSHENPYVELEGVKYFGIPNIPGGVGERSAPIFSESVKPFMLESIRHGFVGALKECPALRNSVSIYEGTVTSKGLAKTFGLEYTPIDTLL